MTDLAGQQGAPEAERRDNDGHVGSNRRERNQRGVVPIRPTHARGKQSSRTKQKPRACVRLPSRDAYFLDARVSAESTPISFIPRTHKTEEGPGLKQEACLPVVCRFHASGRREITRLAYAVENFRTTARRNYSRSNFRFARACAHIIKINRSVGIR